MQKQIDQNEILKTAKQLIERYGHEAVRVAEERANSTVIGEFPSEKDIALTVLTKVEELLNPQTS